VLPQKTQAQFEARVVGRHSLVLGAQPHAGEVVILLGAAYFALMIVISIGMGS
jgi:hypothetical protein